MPPLVELNSEDANACYWCGTQGWINRCGRCGFFTCDACRKPHNADSFGMGTPKYTGVWDGWVRPSRQHWEPWRVPVAAEDASKGEGQ